ncbi:electron transfer flavoprotein subunit alpha/FixB family protein [Ancylobacter sp. 6x-1]|uniref:Electron transfer flavoprotein subunit alpha/FixB family protein n=2 Tax=Ancylobacter crimeensis TaxID=2579147 RepID=A0ABT0DEH1_9HYPH|nr:electron transfer flavoprotein subunit alpha/FixB family protein [Ancylobacter crimeensis]MCK0198350.1 electron transfer flavoprotein subunit alpha/FixB family protein [Ancylobacter crimeensis]
MRLRRDPRTERAAHRIDGTARPRFDLAAAAETTGGRLRRNPRAEVERMLVAGTSRRRLDRSQRSVSTPLHIAAPAETAAAPRLIVIEEPAFLVAVVPDAPGGRLTPHDRQMIGAARLLAEKGGAVLALLAEPCEEIGPAGADRVLLVEASTGYDPEGRSASIAMAVDGLGVRHALFPESVDGGDIARRVAADLGEALFAGAESIAANAVTRASRGRRVEQRRAPPRLISLAADAALPYAGAPREARALQDDPMPTVPTRRAILAAEIIPADPARVPLGEAGFVVSAGNGVTDFDGFRAVAAALGATPGASRVVCDAGLMPRAAQVGASGTVLEATCYFALGIAGAPQHLQGIARCEHVVAVNTDLHAAMIERAGLAIVADAQKVMPALLAALECETETTA